MNRPMLVVTPKMLREGAEKLRALDEAHAQDPLVHAHPAVSALRDCGVEVNAAQLDRAAEILEAAAPSVITSFSGGPVSGDMGPRPRDGYVHAESQDPQHPEVLVFDVGILGSIHRIDREGNEL